MGIPKLHYIRALQKYILQNRESALKDLNSAIEHNSNYAEAYYYRAAIKRDLKDSGFVDDYKKAVYMTKFLGEQFTGTISGVQEFGIFVELENGIEGLVNKANLSEDREVPYEEAVKKYGLQKADSVVTA